MKLCFCIGTLSYSGAEKIMSCMIKEFARRKYDVSIILIASEAHLQGFEGIRQFSVYDKVKKEKNKVIRALKIHHEIRKIVTENQFDCIVSFGVIYNVDLAESCFLSNSKLILCERNDPLFDPKSMILRARRSLSYRRGNAFVFQTKEIMDFFPISIRKKAKIIPNFMDQIIPESKRYDPQRKAVATSARLDDFQKDQSTMIKAFYAFAQKHPEYSLELYGDGPDKEKLMSLASSLGISDKVFFLGRVLDPMQYIRTAEVFILTSRYEGMPNSLIEAMAYGMPCVSTDCSGGGARFLIKNGVNGFLNTVGDVKGIEHNLTFLAENLDAAKAIGNNAYRINNLLSFDDVFDQWETLIQSLIGEKHGKE